jgi:hypothetical protein
MHGLPKAKLLTILAYNLGYRAHELTRIEKIVAAHAAAFLEAWHEYFRTQSQ